MRLIYSLILYFFSPLTFFYLKKRGQQNPHYNQNWHERWGINLNNPSSKPIIWIYAVSVGETRALAKLIELIEINYPNYQILITSMTPTGRNTAKYLYPNALIHYIPYDLPHAVINFYKTFKPKIGLIMETEIWPNLNFYAAKFNIPLYLINARLSNKSFNSYNKIKFILNPYINLFSGILCQDQNSYNNFKKLGFSKDMHIIGNMKFDLNLNTNFSALTKELTQEIKDKKIVAFASTRDGDEELILKNLPANFPHLILIIPRHPERFRLVTELLQTYNISHQSRSTTQIISKDTQVLLGDSLGEMLFYYALADIAVIGGSFNKHGGQNLIEAIFMQKPVIFGPSMFNFKEVAKNALQSKCAIQVNNMQECFGKINELLEDNEKYTTYVNNCHEFIEAHQGASMAVFNYLVSTIS